MNLKDGVKGEVVGTSQFNVIEKKKKLMDDRRYQELIENNF